MKLAYLAFDDMITIPLGRMVGEAMLGDLTESTFLASEGWELAEVSQGVFTLRAPHMPRAMTVGGHGYRYFVEPDRVVADQPHLAEVGIAPMKGKKR